MWPFRRRDLEALEVGRRMLSLSAAPAALLDRGGGVCGMNEAWRTSIPSAFAEGLYPLFRGAAERGSAETTGVFGVEVQSLRLERLTDDLFLAVALLTPKTSAPDMRPESPLAELFVGGSEPFSGRILSVNALGQAQLGRAAEPGVSLDAVFTAESLAQARGADIGAGPVELALLGSERWMDAFAAPEPQGWRLWLADATDRRRLRDQLAQQSKTDAAALLVGSVAHDFNNLITGVALRADDMLLRHPLGDPDYETLLEIRDAARQSAGIVKQLATSVRRSTLRLESVDLGETLARLEAFMRRMLREGIRIESHIGVGLPLVKVDKGVFDSVLINLVVNASHALRAKGGRILVRAERLGPTASLPPGLKRPSEGEFALIQVIDDGPGMTPEVRAQIFEPRFTTKAPGEGTGLGLAVARASIEQFRGVIGVGSEPGQGACFSILLPAFEVVLPPVMDPGPEPSVSLRSARVGRILLVEDDASIRGIAAKLLRGRGHEVVEAEHGEAALDIIKTRRSGFDLMISDVVMPGMDGPQLLTAARPFLGKAGVIFMSGYAESEFTDLLEAEPNVGFMAKPIDLKTLADQVQLALQKIG